MFAFVDSPGSISVLPLAPVPRSSPPADFQDVSYSPTLLLPVHLDASITAAPEYQQGCQDGFSGYFDEMVVWNESGTDLVFVNRFHTRAEIMTLVLNCLVKDRHVQAHLGILIPFCYSVGFALGWLSALSLTDRAHALVGLELLTVLVAHRQKVVS